MTGPWSVGMADRSMMSHNSAPQLPKPPGAAANPIWQIRQNGQLLTHSNHLGTHLDGEIHFYTPGKDIASLDLNDFLVGPGAVVDLSDATGDYQIYTPEMIEERVEGREGDILIIHTGYHHFGWDMPYADEIRYMVQHPGPDREFAEWAKEKKIKWIGVDCGSADHPMPAPGCKHR
jgi:arylformamidase